IEFKDITTLMADGEVYKKAIDEMVTYAQDRNVDVIVGPEARGFIFGCPVAYALGKGFIPVRKEGKLPRDVIKVDYGLEYGENRSEEHTSELQSRFDLVCRLLL